MQEMHKRNRKHEYLITSFYMHMEKTFLYLFSHNILFFYKYASYS